MCAANHNILVVDNQPDNAKLQNLAALLEKSNMTVNCATDVEEAMYLLDKDTRAVLVDWHLENDPQCAAVKLVMENIKRQNGSMPIYLMLHDDKNDNIGQDVLELIEGFFWLDDNTTEIAKEISKAISRACTTMHNMDFRNFKNYVGQDFASVI